MAKARILCLHGYAQNGAFFRQRTGSLRRALKKDVGEFVFLDAPFPATAAFLGDGAEDRGPALGWWTWDDAARATGGSFEYRGADEALARVRACVAAEGPFDGILGFSQGATMAALLCLSSRAKPPFRFAILCSGFSPHDPRYASLCEELPPANLPTLHVCGEADARVLPAKTRMLAACFASAEVHVHAGGHAIPSNPGFRSALQDFMARQRPQADDGEAVPPASAPSRDGAAGGELRPPSGVAAAHGTDRR